MSTLPLADVFATYAQESFLEANEIKLFLEPMKRLVKEGKWVLYKASEHKYTRAIAEQFVNKHSCVEIRDLKTYTPAPLGAVNVVLPVLGPLVGLYYSNGLVMETKDELYFWLEKRTQEVFGYPDPADDTIKDLEPPTIDPHGCHS